MGKIKSKWKTKLPNNINKLKRKFYRRARHHNIDTESYFKRYNVCEKAQLLLMASIVEHGNGYSRLLKMLFKQDKHGTI